MLGLGLGIATATTIFDQATKWLILAWIAPLPHTVEVFSIFNIVLVWNRGVSFGLFDSASPWAPVLLSALASTVTLFLIIWLRRIENRLLAIGVGLIIGGAVGNIIDRLRYGAVVDFFDFHIGEYHWPAFNIADIAISVGVFLVIFDGIIARRRVDG